MSYWRRPWERKIDIKQFLEGDDSPEEAVRAAKALAEYIRKHVPDYEDVDELLLVEEEPRKWQLAQLNQCLDDFYDWADEHRVWCGL